MHLKEQKRVTIYDFETQEPHSKPEPKPKPQPEDRPPPGPPGPAKGKTKAKTKTKRRDADGTTEDPREKSDKEDMPSGVQAVGKKKKDLYKKVESVCSMPGARTSLADLVSEWNSNKSQDFYHKVSQWLLCNLTISVVLEPQPQQKKGQGVPLIVKLVDEYNIHIRSTYGEKVEKINMITPLGADEIKKKDNLRKVYRNLPTRDISDARYSSTSKRIKNLALLMLLIEDYSALKGPKGVKKFEFKPEYKKNTTLMQLTSLLNKMVAHKDLMAFKLPPLQSFQVAPGGKVPKPQQESTTMNKNDIKQLIKEAFTDNIYGKYPYSHRAGDDNEPKEDYVEDWKKFCLSIVQDKSKEQAIALAKIFIQDLELFEDVLDLAGQNQSIGSEILKKMQKNQKNMV